MKRPILDSFVAYNIFPVELLQEFRKTCDDDEILCYVLFRFYEKPTADISKQYNIPLDTVNKSITKIDLVSKGKANRYIAASLLDILVHRNECSQSLITKLRENYDDVKILCFIMFNGLECSANFIAQKLSIFSEKEVKDNATEIERYLNDIKYPYNFEPRNSNDGYGSHPINSNAYYNGPRFKPVILDYGDDEPEDVSADWGYLEDMQNGDNY